MSKNFSEVAQFSGKSTGADRQTSAVICDYVWICEKRGEVMDFAGFLELWEAANARAEEACRDGEASGDLIDRILAGEA
jgi:hypothetical protein